MTGTGSEVVSVKNRYAVIPDRTGDQNACVRLAASGFSFLHAARTGLKMTIRGRAGR
jgi:hypothetical protein